MLLAMLACTAVVTAETLEVRMRIHQKAAEEKIINRENLIRIKQSILQNGQRTTYCNAYNNNPSQHTKRFYFYLNPDSGQNNIDCDSTKSDFNSLTIRAAGGGKNQYRTVGFIDKNYVYITANNPTDDLTVSQVRQFVEDALQEFLAAIEASQAPGDQQPFDEVLWVERPKPEISLLYLVLTNTGGHDDRVRLVVSHAAVALREAAKHQGHEFNVVYFVRPSGMYTGFSVEQLREIVAASQKRAEELVGQHTWGIGELPKPAAQGGAIRLESNRDAATIMQRIRAAIEAGPMFEKLSEILGEPDLDIGSGIHIFVYRLSDGTGITVGTPDKNKVMYIEHAGKRLFPVEKEQGAGSVVTAPVAAGGTPDAIDKKPDDGKPAP